MIGLLILTLLIPGVGRLFLKRYEDKRKAANRNTLLIHQLYIILVTLFLIIANHFLVKQWFSELFYFLTGLILSFGIAFIFTFINFKLSLHTTAIAAFLGFMAGSSILHAYSAGPYLALLIFALGWTSSSALAQHQHKKLELAVGILIGLIPQALLFGKIILIHRI